MPTDKKEMMSDSWISSQFEKIFLDPTVEDYQRSVLETTWMRNILYYLGEQWLSWYEQQNTFGRRFEFGTQVPTPVSNIIRDHVRSMKALIMNKRFSIRVWPNSMDLEDIDAAKLGEALLKDMDTTDDFYIEDVKEMVALWMVMTGNGFARTYANVDNGEYVVGAGGDTITRGEVMTDALLPFNVVVPTLGRRMRFKSFVGLKSLRSKEWVEDTYKVLLNKGESSKSMLSYERQLLKLVSSVSPWKGRGFNVDVEHDRLEDMVMFKEIECRPTKDFPKGRYYAMADEKVVVARDSLPIPVDKQGRWCYTVTHFPYNYTPGSFWASGGVDDLISPQNTINEVDQSLAINRKSLGRTMVISPSELIVKRKSARGQALLEILYDARTAPGGKPPQIHPGVQLPNQILEERAVNRTVAQEAGGDPKNVLRGQAPTSGASGVMVDILREAAELSHTPDINRFYRRWQSVQRKRLITAQNLYTEERMVKIAGKGKDIQIRAFKGADLRGNNDVRLEPDNAMATTNAGRNELLTRLIQGGFFGDITQRPELQRDLVQRMGLGSIPEENDVHINKAEYENSVLAHAPLVDKKGNATKFLARIALPGKLTDPETGQSEQIFPETHDPTFRFDNHEVHLRILEKLLLSDEYRTFDEERQGLIVAHYDMHQGALQQQMDDELARAAIAQAVTQGVQGEGLNVGEEPGPIQEGPEMMGAPGPAI